MAGLVTFMNGIAGRLLRIVLGLVLIYWGFSASGGTTVGIIVGVIGIVPLVMGVWGRCLLQFLPGRAKS